MQLLSYIRVQPLDFNCHKHFLAVLYSSIAGLPLSIKFARTHLYTWMERGEVRVKCIALEHYTMSSTRAQTGTARSGAGRTSHKATMPPSILW